MTPVLQSQMDLAAFIAFAAAEGWWCVRFLKRRRIKPLKTRWAATAVLLGVGGACAAALLSAPEGPTGLRIVNLTLGALLTTALLAIWVGGSLLGGEARHQREAVQRLRRAKDIADVQSRAQSEFLAVVSHEIRTPLTAVMGFASVLSETKLDKTQRRYIGTILSASERLVALLNDVLDFSKLEEGRLALQRAPFVPALVVHEVVELLHSKASEKNLVLRFQNQLPSPLTVEGDASRIRQVLLNLVSNAVKFTDQGSVTIEASWAPPDAGAKAGMLSFKVTDTGIGIPAHKLRTIFQMLSQLNPAAMQRFGASGLGLSICHRLTELMGGKIQAESSLGEGSTFVVTIPCALSRTGSTPPHSGTDAEKSTDTTPLLGRVLVVDDQELSRELMRVLVRRLGYEADVAASGAQGVELATSGKYAAVLMDLEMPGMDGFAATERIRATETNGSRVPVVAVTARISPGTREKCIGAGMDDYLTKPIYLPALKAALAEIAQSSGK